MYHGVFHKFEYKNFRVNLNNLKNSIKVSKKTAVDEAKYLRSTLANGPINRYNEPSRQSSDSKVRMVSGFKSGYLDGKKPRAIYDLNKDNKKFTFKQFSDNFYKEKYADKKKNY